MSGHFRLGVPPPRATCLLCKAAPGPAGKPDLIGQGRCRSVKIAFVTKTEFSMMECSTGEGGRVQSGCSPEVDDEDGDAASRSAAEVGLVP